MKNINEQTLKQFLMELPQKTHVKILAKVIQSSGKIADSIFKKNYGDLTSTEWKMPVEKTIHVNGIELSYLHWPNNNNKKPFLALHGINAVAWSWARVASLLSEDREVIALSLRGHGASEAPQNGYELEDTSNDIAAFMDALELEKVHLSGESWGGKVATHMAATNPDRIKSLVLADPVLPQGLNPFLSKFPFFIMAALLQERASFDNKQTLEKAGDKIIYLPLGDEIDKRSWAARFRKNETSYHPGLPNENHAEIIGKALMRDISPLMENFSVPTLLIIPTMSIAFWPGEFKTIKSLIPNLEIRKIKGDHTFISCTPIKAAKLIQDYLNK